MSPKIGDSRLLSQCVGNVAITMRYDKALRAFVELAASRHNAIHSNEAAEIITTRRLRDAELEGHVFRLHPSVWALSALPNSAEQELRGAVLSVAGAAATTTSAAWLHGWLDRPPPRPQLWVPPGRSRSHRLAELARWSRLDPSLDLTVVDHIATLNKAATLCSLGPHVDRPTLERCLDEFLRTESPRWLFDTMERLGSRKPGGVQALQRLLEDPKRIDGVPESWFERVVAGLVVIPWLPPVRFQHVVETSGGRHRLDIACPELQLGVEAHSRTFHWGADRADADNVRDLHLSAEGWHVLYVTWSQVRQPELFIKQYAAVARSRAELLGVDLPAA